MDLAPRVLGGFASVPRIVFVTTTTRHAVEAFEMRSIRLPDEPGAGGAAASGALRDAVRRRNPGHGQDETHSSAGRRHG